MDFKKIAIKLEKDGIRLIDQGAGLVLGTPMTVRYQVESAWSEKEVEFEREAPTLFHPFRKSMFIYTGSQPRRVFVRPRQGGFDEGADSGPGAYASAEQRRTAYERNNFQTYPDFDDDEWDAEWIADTVRSIARSGAAEAHASQPHFESSSTQDFAPLQREPEVPAPSAAASPEPSPAWGEPVSASDAPGENPPSEAEQESHAGIGFGVAAGGESSGSAPTEPNAY